jgi:hypothetical protein
VLLNLKGMVRLEEKRKVNVNMTTNYNMHIRPLKAELLDIGEVTCAAREHQAPWLSSTDAAWELPLV